MLKYVHTSWLHFVLVYIAIMLDGGIALYFAPVLFKMPMSASPYLSLIVMMMPVLTGTVTQMKERSLYIAAFLGGLLFDIFYSGLIGISMIGFPLTVWLASKLQRYLPTSFMSSVAVWFVSMSMYLVFDYAGFGIINLTNLNIPDFIIFHMFPTLIINLMLLVLVYGLLNYWYHTTRQPDISAYNVDDSDLNGRLPSLNSKSRSRSIR
ncbi:rod shape-determining protein MreD [Weissella confusa]|jgi:rod shape-determining protein MreD|uniref:rod shape-determining protein MreD n=1 Tax=Weissella confusa TaxID=1583 RepID=UPI0005DF84B0|nr:rod shape-determining protein MreD [Weissella confusa]COI53396.1 rod shape-determining protein MreD [Streptococcus pneumoniae]MBD1492182.1 rod shape-determining protein MreD [Weissella confusa]MBD5832839.1 rod shape-determining protein MreD [Weissella confusa]MBF7057531.1 rod shape-determining protein MreD [Weissella confusa]MBJ7622374.1 rod shape-determining protein MreD [Weissella confusa]